MKLGLVYCGAHTSHLSETMAIEDDHTVDITCKEA